MSFRDWVERNELDKPVWKCKDQWGRPNRLKPCRMKHRAGLPLSDGSECLVDVSDDLITVSTAGGDAWELAKAKVTNVERFTEQEVQVEVRGRPGMALLGGLTLGVVGAIAGGVMTKERRRTITTEFLCLTYVTGDGETGTLLFQYDDYDSWHDKWRPKMVVKDFSKHRESYAPDRRHAL